MEQPIRHPRLTALVMMRYRFSGIFWVKLNTSVKPPVKSSIASLLVPLIRLSYEPYNLSNSIANVNPLDCRGNYSATLNDMKLVHCWPRWWVGCYIWYSEEGTGRGRSTPSSLLALPNLTANPSAASVPITVLLARYSVVLMCPWLSAGNVFISCATALYLYASTSNTMSELIIESHKNATIVLRSGCEQQRHTYLDKTWQPQNHVT